ncbi:MAG: hypothetical protein SFU98_00950 [Leptospiraceae bacterium]|nr:hypothetical protein [Leptospiraceae bacterium]
MIKILILSLTLLFVSLEAKPAVLEKQSVKATRRILKEINWKKIQKSLEEELNFGAASNIPYYNCSAEFPELPANFPCSFLTEDSGKDGPVSLDTMDGGKISLRNSVTRGVMGGLVILVSGEDDDAKSAMKLFYKKDNYISHYLFENKLTVFLWKKEKGEPTLKKIYILSLGDSKEPNSISRVKL